MIQVSQHMNQVLSILSFNLNLGDGDFYKYTDFSCGSFNIAEMKRLAIAGDGLNEFINENKAGHDSKW